MRWLLLVIKEKMLVAKLQPGLIECKFDKSVFLFMNIDETVVLVFIFSLKVSSLGSFNSQKIINHKLHHIVKTYS